MGIALDMATTTSSGAGSSFVQSAGSHLFQIDGYSVAKQAPDGTSLKSCPFTVGDYQWMLHLFPNGDSPESAGFISVFICPYGFDKDKRWRVSLQLEFSFIDDVEKQNPAHVRSRQVIELIVNYGAGYSRFIAREALENSKHLKGDRFTVRCDIIITGYVVFRPENWQENDPARRRRCVACGLRPVTVVGQPLMHACFCDTCKEASRNDPAAKQCAGCHGPYNGRGLLPPPSSS